MWLFFGCRNESQDWIFREEMEGFLKKGTLARLSTAFSRDSSEKIYVQVMRHAIHTTGGFCKELGIFYYYGGHTIQNQTCLAIILEYKDIFTCRSI